MNEFLPAIYYDYFYGAQTFSSLIMSGRVNDLDVRNSLRTSRRF